MTEPFKKAHRAEQIQAAGELLQSLTEDEFKPIASSALTGTLDLSKTWFKMPMVWVYRIAVFLAVTVSPIIWFIASHYVNLTYPTKEELRTAYVSKEEMTQYQMTLTNTLKSLEKNLDALTITQQEIGKNQQSTKEVLAVLVSKVEYDKVQDTRMANIEQMIQKNFDFINSTNRNLIRVK